MPVSRTTANATIRAGQFVAQAEHVARALPRAAHVINLSENRYHFLLGWVAACLRESGDAVAVRAGRTTCSQNCGTSIRTITRSMRNRSSASSRRRPRRAARPIPAHWQLPAERIVAIAFTSGSTGESTPHPKTWGSLFHNSRLAAAEVLGGTNRTLVSTVPPQHMYGLEASLLSALTAESVLFDDKPFYPADVRRALEAMPAPRVLVTTPAHLKVLADAAVELPPLDRVVSATAPLPVELARRIETAWQYAARGDLWLHRSRRHGASKAFAIRKLAHVRWRDDDDVSGRRRIFRTAARRRRAAAGRARAAQRHGIFSSRPRRGHDQGGGQTRFAAGAHAADPGVAGSRGCRGVPAGRRRATRRRRGGARPHGGRHPARAAHAPRWRVRSAAAGHRRRTAAQYRGQTAARRVACACWRRRAHERRDHQRVRRAGGSSFARRAFSRAAGGARGGVARCGAGGDPDAWRLRAAIDSRGEVSAARAAGRTRRTAHPVHTPSTPRSCARAFRGCARRRWPSRDRSSCRRVQNHERLAQPQGAKHAVDGAAHRPAGHDTAAPGRAAVAVSDRRVFPAHEPGRARRRRATTCAACSVAKPGVARSVAALLRVRELHARSHLPVVEAPSIHRGRRRPPGRGSRRGRAQDRVACCSSRISAARSRCASSRSTGAACRCRSCSTANTAACSPNYSRS